MAIVPMHLRKMPLIYIGAWFHLKVGRCGYRAADTMVWVSTCETAGMKFYLGFDYLYVGIRSEGVNISI
jgi:hypothetical protein